MNSDILFKKILSKKAKIGVIGLGYVGLPLAILFATKGYDTVGFLRDKIKAKSLNEGKNHLLDDTLNEPLKNVLDNQKLKVVTIDENGLDDQDVIIICVPTPVTHGKQPDLSDLQAVRDKLSMIDVTNKLIINESTVAPFTTRELLGTLKGSYFLACSPERIDPGNKTKTIDAIPKVIGGIDKDSLLLGKTLYEQILQQEVIGMSSLEAAEMTKMLENTYRAVNIALMNEFALLAEKCGIDILEIIKGAKSKWSFHAHYPGVGVGGHCIPVDPYYILELARVRGVNMHVVEDGLKQNEKMPYHVYKKVKVLYKKNMKVLVYGLTYKKDVFDLRESPVVTLCNLLKQKNIEFVVYDPLVSDEIITDLGFVPSPLKAVDLFIVGTDHSVLSTDYPKAVTQDTIIIDGRNFFGVKTGKHVYGIGRTLL